METTTNKILGYLKLAFWGLLVMQLASMVSMQIIGRMRDAMSPHIGYMVINSFIEDSMPYLKQLEVFSKNESIKVLVMRIDSRGGTPAASQAVFSRVRALATQKPIVACIDNVGASGAYYIAAGAKTIFANSASTIGSIGVAAELPNIKRLMDAWNVQCEYVQSGKYKTMGSMARDTTDEELVLLQALSDDLYQQFLSDVALARNLDVSKSEEWADGKVFSGRQALKLGLVDQLGSMHDALRQAKIFAGIDPDQEVSIVSLSQKREGLLAKLLQSDGSDDDQFGQVVARCFSVMARSFLA